MPVLSRRAKILLIVVAVIILLLLVIPYFINLDRYRDDVAQMLMRETGKRVTIGSLRLSLLPTAGFELAEIHVSNPPDFPPGDLLAVQRIRASVPLRSLLSRVVRITSLRIVEPTLNLVVDDRGRMNYESKPREAGRERGTASAAALFTLGDISDVSLRDATFSYGRASRGRIIPSWRVADVNADLARLITEASRLADLDSTIQLKHTEVEIAGLKEPVKFRSGKVTVRQKQAEGKCEASLGKTVVRVSFRIPDIEKPLAEFELHSPEMNLGELAVLAAPTRAQASSESSKTTHKLLGRGKVAVERLRFAPHEMSSFQAQARLFDDLVELNPASARLYAGTIAGSLVLNMKAAPPVLTLDAKIENVDTGKALSTGGQPSKVRGRFGASGRISGPLGRGDFLSGLNGGGQFAVRDGVITAFNMNSRLAKIAQLVSFDQSGPVNETPFSFFGGDFRLAGGRLYSDQLRLESPQLEATGSGSAGFDGTLDYKGWASLSTATGGTGGGGGAIGALGKILGTVMQQTAGRMRVPFALRGSFSSPQFLPAGLPVAEKASSRQQ